MAIQTSRDTFKEYSVDNKLLTLFDIAVAQQACQEKQLEKCAGRFEKIEKRKLWDKGTAIAAGIVGGAAAVFTKMSFWS